MTFRVLGPDPLSVQVNQVMAELAAGRLPGELETRNVDVKEEPARRAHGKILPGQPQNERAAEYLTGELACLANTVGGGVLILGIADDGERIGTDLDIEWLRHRIFELSQRRLTVEIRPYELDGARLLLIRTAEAIEPVEYRGRLKWRLDANCIDVNPTNWWAGRMHRTGYDWSAKASGHTLSDVRPGALAVARTAIAETDQESTTLALSEATDADLLRRLNLLTTDGHLTTTGSVLFVPTPSSALDYIRRDYPGGDSTMRIRTSGPLLTQLAEVEQAAMSANRIIHLPDGFVNRQVRAIPTTSLREAIVNGIVHRSWQSEEPTVVEHVGDTLTVTSPGGFLEGVTPENIITYPSTPRYRSLAEAMSAIGLADREGIGIDRMVAAGIAMGQEPPVFSELSGPKVRVVLLGGDPDTEWVKFITSLLPESLRRDVDVLLLLDQVATVGWLDAESAAAATQKHEHEANAAIGKLAEGVIRDSRVLQRVHGTPTGSPVAWRLSDGARQHLKVRLQRTHDGAGRLDVIANWARKRGRISSTEAADLVGVSAPTASRLLQELEDDGVLEPSWASRSGRGFHYVPAQG